MKKTIFFLAATIVALSFAACSKDDNEPKQPGDTTEVYIDATSSTIWQYYSFAENKVVGSAEGNETNDAAWAARKDWDIAIRTMYVRTNGGTSTKVGALGGLFTFDINNKDEAGNINTTTSFASVQNVPDAATFVIDKVVTYTSMGGDITTSQSEARVTAMKKQKDKETGVISTVMPPIYLKSPVYIFRSADGNYYKVEFTQYKDENNKSGHVMFNAARIYKN